MRQLAARCFELLNALSEMKAKLAPDKFKEIVDDGTKCAKSS